MNINIDSPLSVVRSVIPSLEGTKILDVGCEEAMHDNVTAVRRCGISSNHIVGDRSTETIMTAFTVEPEQMVAIGVPLDAPELPDHASFDKDFVHRSTRTTCAPKAVLARSHGRVSYAGRAGGQKRDDTDQNAYCSSRRRSSPTRAFPCNSLNVTSRNANIGQFTVIQAVQLAKTFTVSTPSPEHSNQVSDEIHRCLLYFTVASL